MVNIEDVLWYFRSDFVPCKTMRSHSSSPLFFSKNQEVGNVHPFFALMLIMIVALILYVMIRHGVTSWLQAILDFIGL